jgi:hypothetical protein
MAIGNNTSTGTMGFSYNSWFCVTCQQWVFGEHVHPYSYPNDYKWTITTDTTSISVPEEPSFDQAVHDLASRLADMVIQKQRDYGTGNILDAPGGPEKGIVVRLWDKISRLKNLVYGGKKPQNETIDDTYKDIAGYCLVALMVREGKFTLPMKEY